MQQKKKRKHDSDDYGTKCHRASIVECHVSFERLSCSSQIKRSVCMPDRPTGSDDFYISIL